MDSVTVYNLTPVDTNSPIEPGDQLNAPTACRAIYSAKNNTLTVSGTITLPEGESLSNITLEQYYSEEDGLQFYYVYNFATPAGVPYNSFACSFVALNKDFNGNAIPLSSLTSILQLIQDIDPKTSRGTTTPITHNTEN